MTRPMYSFSRQVECSFDPDIDGPGLSWRRLVKLSIDVYVGAEAEDAEYAIDGFTVPRKKFMDVLRLMGCK